MSESTPALLVVDLGDERVRVSAPARPTEWIVVPGKDWALFTERVAAGKRPLKRDPVQCQKFEGGDAALWHVDATLGGTLWLDADEWVAFVAQVRAAAQAATEDSAKTTEEGTD